MRYGVQGSGSTQMESVSADDATEITIFRLTQDTSYTIELAAVNSAGTGEYSNTLAVDIHQCEYGVVSYRTFNTHFSLW